MKILYLHQYFNTNKNRGGTRSYEFSKALIENGCYIYMISGKDTNKKEIDFLKNIEIYSTKTKYSNSMSYMRRILAFMHYIIKSIIIGIKLKGIDTVFATSTPLTIAIPGYILSKIHRSKFIFEVRDVWPDIPIGVGVLKNRLLIVLLKKYEYFVYKKADHIIVASEGMYKNLINKGVSKDKVTVITNMANLYLVDSIKKSKTKIKEYNGFKDKFICIHSGSMGFVNGLDYILNVAKLIEKIDRNIIFILIGEGKEKESLKRRKNKENINNVIFMDILPKKELFFLLKAADIGVMIVKNYKILQDNSANKFFDYLAVGLPILINYGGWQKEVLESHKAGFSCSATNFHDMAKKILYLRRNEKLLEKMSKNSRALAEDKFSRSICCNKLVNIFKNL